MKPLSQHFRAGTFNITRHRDRLAAALAPTPEPAWERWQPSVAELAPLGPTGRPWATRIAAEWQLDFGKGLLVLRAARALDRIVLFEDAVDTASALVDGKAHPLLTHLRAEIRTFQSLVGALDLEDKS